MSQAGPSSFSQNFPFKLGEYSRGCFGGDLGLAGGRHVGTHYQLQIRELTGLLGVLYAGAC
jgi:hypothetical protein